MQLKTLRFLLIGLSGAIASACAVSVQAPMPASIDGVYSNQIGFLPDRQQGFTVRSDDKRAFNWVVRDVDSRIVRRGSSQVVGYSEAAGHQVHTVEISPNISIEGEYQIEVGGRRVHTFKIASDFDEGLAEAALKYFYYNRAGIPILTAFVPDPKWARDAGHSREEVTCFAGTDKTGLNWPSCEHQVDVAGGWYDAGDYGKYVVNAGLSVWLLQNSAERLVHNGGLSDNGWGDGRVTLPETGNGVSEILDEARWEIEFLMRMQVPDGVRMSLPVGRQSIEDGARLTLTEIDASGMAHHKVHEAKWLPLPLLPKDATETRALYPPSTAATLNLAAVTAQCARLWRDLDAEFANRCLHVSISAYDAALKNPEVYAYNNFDGGGAYGDLDVADEFAWASLELFATTKLEKYRSSLSETPASAWQHRLYDQSLRDVFWADVDLLPLLTTLTTKDPFSDQDIVAAEAIIRKTADRYLDDLARDGYRAPMPVNGYAWGSNGAIAARSLVLGMAFDLTQNASYLDANIAILDYLLGRNPLGQSYIAGFGTNPVKFVHHRFWAAGADPSYPIAPPGALSGGPNAGYPADPINEKAELDDCSPQTCWADDYTAFSLNEVAINWNSALFWLAAYLDTTPTHKIHSAEK